MKKILAITILTFFLFSCSEEIKVVDNVPKQDFFVKTKQVKEFWKSLDLEKNWVLSSSQDIKLNSKVSWRVSKIYVKEWEYVKKWDIIARLEDSIANYWLSLQRAKNNLEKSKINYENTENQLNKQISDLKINLDNLKIDENNSKSSLELEKLENNIKKLALDYDNLKIWNLASISNFKNSMWKDLISFITFTDDVIDFSDKILWVSTKNSDLNNSYENYLWAKNTEQKSVSEVILMDLIKYRNNDLIKVDFNFDWTSWFEKNITTISNWYSKINSLLTNLDTTLDNSVSSVWKLSKTDIANKRSNIKTFWISYNQNNTWFITLKNSLNSFIDTYKNKEESLLKQINLLYSDKKIYVKWLDVKLEIDKSTLDEAISNKDLTLRQLDTSIVDAQINYKQALDNFNKLGIRSPINWNIWKIFINIGQEVWNWTPLFNISNTTDNEVIVSFSKNELNDIKVWTPAYITFNNTVFTGSIYSISNIADSNLNYVSRISFNQWTDIIWDVVKVSIPFNSDKVVLPINIMKVDSNWMWIINVFNSWAIEKQSFKIGNIYSDKVEILDEINPNLNIIVSDIDNFDEGKFELKVK